jgi:uncharacterized protein YkwD
MGMGIVPQIALEGANQRIYAKSSIPKYSEIERMETELVQMINAARAEHGLAPLNICKDLVLCARQHSDNMAKRIVRFGHGGFEGRAEEMKSKIVLKSFGENVAYSYNVNNHLKTAIQGWMDSPGHKKNILGDYSITGIGISFNKDGYCYTTQLFAKLK